MTWSSRSPKRRGARGRRDSTGSKFTHPIGYLVHDFLSPRYNKRSDAYGGSLEEKPELYRARSVLAHAAELTMPIILTMGEKDALIPVEETRKVAQALKPNPDFRYHEVPDGNHDSALWVDIDLEAFEQTCRQRSGND